QASTRSARADSYARYFRKREGHAHHQRPAYHRRALGDGITAAKIEKHSTRAINQPDYGRRRRISTAFSAGSAPTWFMPINIAAIISAETGFPFTSLWPR